MADNCPQADGRVLHVFPKLGGSTPPTAPAPRTHQKAQKENNGIVVDGSLGFEPMQIEGGSNTGLYSDRLVGSSSNQTYNRRGRGGRGGRGGNNR